MSWTPCICEPARVAAERGRGMGHVRVACDSCYDQLRQTMFFGPPHDCGHRPLTGCVTGPDLGLERVGDDGQGNCNRCGPVRRGNADQADDLIGPVRTDDAGVPARGYLAGGDRKRCWVELMAVILGLGQCVVPPGWFVLPYVTFSGSRSSRLPCAAGVWETPPSAPPASQP